MNIPTKFVFSVNGIRECVHSAWFTRAKTLSKVEDELFSLQFPCSTVGKLDSAKKTVENLSPTIWYRNNKERISHADASEIYQKALKDKLIPLDFDIVVIYFVTTMPLFIPYTKNITFGYYLSPDERNVTEYDMRIIDLTHLPAVYRTDTFAQCVASLYKSKLRSHINGDDDNPIMSAAAMLIYNYFTVEATIILCNEEDKKPLQQAYSTLCFALVSADPSFNALYVTSNKPNTHSITDPKSFEEIPTPAFKDLLKLKNIAMVTVNYKVSTEKEQELAKSVALTQLFVKKSKGLKRLQVAKAQYGSVNKAIAKAYPTHTKRLSSKCLNMLAEELQTEKKNNESSNASAVVAAAL